MNWIKLSIHTLTDGIEALCGKLYTTAGFAGFKQQMNLCVMAKRLVVAYALNSVCNSLFINNTALFKFNLYAEALCYDTP